MTSTADRDAIMARAEAIANIQDRPLGNVWRWAASNPDRMAVLSESRGLSYAELRSAIIETALLLRGRGVRGGDRLLIAAENNVACVVLMLAGQFLDAWPAIINSRAAPAEIAQMRSTCGPRLLVFAVEEAPSALQLSASEPAEHLQAKNIGSVLCWRTASDSVPEPVSVGAEHQVGLLIFTSGTLGLAKAVMISHAALANLGSVLADSRHTSAGDVVHGVAPLSHIMGMSNLMSAFHAGATLQLMPRLSSPQLAVAIAAGDLTHLSFVPAVYAKLVEHIELHNIDMSRNNLRYISFGGAPLDPTLKTRIERLFGVRLVNGYGMTECAPALRSAPDRDTPANCIGWAERGVQTRIVDGAETDVLAGEAGELWLRSSTMMLGYYGDAAETARALRPGGWLATGDMACRLADGSTAIVGRKKELIIRSGFNVYPAEVEAAIGATPQVLQSGVVGRKAADGNEEIIAFVQLRSGSQLSVTDLATQLRDRIAPYKCPSHIVIVEDLPTGRTGKIWKAKLAEMALKL